MATHEFGHYISAKLLDPASKPIIHLFSNGSLNSPLISIGDLNVHIETLDLSFNLIRPILNSTSTALMTASGPIVGLTSKYLFLFTKTFIQKYKETKNFKNSIVFAFKHGHTPFKNLLKQKNLGSWQFLIKLKTIFRLMLSITEEIFYGFSPIDFQGGGDGWHLWQKFFNEDRAFKYELCTLVQNNTKIELPLMGVVDDIPVIKNLYENSTNEFPLADQYDKKYIINDIKFMRQIKEFVDKKGNDWCLNSNDQRLGRGLIVKTYFAFLLSVLFLLHKTSNCFCSFMFNEKTMFHACWNKILRPVGRGVKAFPGRLKTLWSLLSRRCAPCKQKAY
ncbi:hypothetical protein K9L05_04095 [Candidatus Babeliales bacterium]|nr:hypothetical protein [Candidatus Babeliales bacterium]MCF7899797.1 hypothetical protein [Candidatus Babeliales bacterium]